MLRRVRFSLAPECSEKTLIHEEMAKCLCLRPVTLQKISEGMYRICDTVKHVKVFRDRIMVRDGDCWTSLEHYMDKHDPCRCGSKDQLLLRTAPGHQMPPSPTTTPNTAQSAFRKPGQPQQAVGVSRKRTFNQSDLREGCNPHSPRQKKPNIAENTMLPLEVIPEEEEMKETI